MLFCFRTSSKPTIDSEVRFKLQRYLALLIVVVASHALFAVPCLGAEVPNMLSNSLQPSIMSGWPAPRQRLKL